MMKDRLLRYIILEIFVIFSMAGIANSSFFGDMDEIKNDLKDSVLDIQEVSKSFDSRAESGNIKKLAAVSHILVFTHKNYPYIVFKMGDRLSVENRFNNAKKVMETVANKKYKFIRMPEVAHIAMEANGQEYNFLLMENMPTLELFARVKFLKDRVLKSSDSELKMTSEEFREHFQELADLIFEVGYWDIQWGNIHLDPETGKFSLIDFEELYDKNQYAEKNFTQLEVYRKIINKLFNFVSFSGSPNNLELRNGKDIVFELAVQELKLENPSELLK